MFVGIIIWLFELLKCSVLFGLLFGLGILICLNKLLLVIVFSNKSRVNKVIFFKNKVVFLSGEINCLFLLFGC